MIVFSIKSIASLIKSLLCASSLPKNAKALVCATASRIILLTCGLSFISCILSMIAELPRRLSGRICGKLLVSRLRSILGSGVPSIPLCSNQLNLAIEYCGWSTTFAAAWRERTESGALSISLMNFLDATKVKSTSGLLTTKGTPLALLYPSWIILGALRRNRHLLMRSCIQITGNSMTQSYGQCQCMYSS
jgi:hypothetical protein